MLVEITEESIFT